MNAAPEFDVIVAGAGPVGTTMAALLAVQNFSVMLVDARREVAVTPGDWDPRAYALSPASRRILASAGAWERIPEKRIGRIERMRVWDAGGRGVIEFDSREVAAPVLGYIVEQPVLQEALDAVVASDRRIVLRRGAAASGVDWRGDAATLRLSDGTSYRARLVVAADGADSPLRSAAGIDYPVRDYGQEALVCVVRTEAPHGNTARQRFLPDGPLAFLPLAAPDWCGIVWSTTPTRARSLLAMEEEIFLPVLAEAFDHALGRILECGPRRTFPLRGAQAERYGRGRLVLVGDAAHCVHPLAGQGVNLGLLDVAALAEILSGERGRGRDIGGGRALRRYERWRRGEDGAMVLALEGFKHLFGSRNPVIAGLRNAGMTLVDRSGPVKHAIMRRAMGIAGDVPDLVRGAG